MRTLHWLVIISSFLVGLSAVQAARPELNVYTYDSLVGKQGWLTAIQPGFEKICECRLRFLASGDAGQMAARLGLDAERGKPGAHVAVGIDQYQWPRTRKLAETLGDWQPAGLDKIRPELKIGFSNDGLIAIDYGVFAFMLDQQEWSRRFPTLAVPTSLEDLKAAPLRRTLLLEDPRTSTPGQAFALYLHEIFGPRMPEYLESLRSQWLTLAPGWDQAYGLFLKGEAPLVWSYTTSQAYHRENGDRSGRYRAIVFKEGQPLQIEGALIVKGSHQTSATRTLSRQFLEYLISETAQALLPQRQWMLPARQGASLPVSFQNLPTPKLLRLPTDAATVETVLKTWDIAVHAKGKGR